MTTAKILWKPMPKTIVALRQKSVMKTVLKKNKAASQQNSSEEEIDPWSTLINDAASKVRDQYDDILQALLIEGHDESEAKQEAFEKILPVFQKELGDVYMDNLAWMKALKKDPIHKKIMATRDDYVNNNMFDPDEAMAAAVKRRKLRRSRTFSRTTNPNTTEPKINYCPN